MTTKTKLTYGEMRTNAEKIADEALKARVLRGIEVLNEKYGPDWVDRVDVDVLDIASSRECILGQVYDGAEVPEDAWHLFAAEHNWAFTTDWRHSDGYNRGLAILDGEVANDPAAFGFESAAESYHDLDGAWLAVFGQDV